MTSVNVGSAVIYLLSSAEHNSSAEVFCFLLVVVVCVAVVVVVVVVIVSVRYCRVVPPLSGGCRRASCQEVSIDYC